MQVQVLCMAILNVVIREPLLVGTLQVSGSTIDEMQELQARISCALEVVAG